MILVTVGTEQYPFNTLLDWINALLQAGFISPGEEVIVQYGASTRLPDRVKVYQRLPEAEFRNLVAQARLVIAHCGEGTALLLKNFDVPYVLVPRTHRLGEHVDDHQLEMAAALEKQGVAIARSPADLVRFLATPTATVPYSPSDETLCDVLTQLCPARATQRLMLVCSAGGHFKAMQGLRGFWAAFAKRTWVTFQTRGTESELMDQGDRAHWAYHPTNRNIPNLLRNLILAVGVLQQERPDVIVSTGAGVAVPFLLLAKLLHGSTVVFVESKTRLQKLSLSAQILRVCGVLDHLIIQSAALAPLYPEALVVDLTAAQNMDPSGEAAPSTPSSSAKTVEPLCRLHHSVLVTAPALQGDLDGATLLQRIEMAYPSFSQTLPLQTLVLDMQGIQSIDSAGLDALVRAWRTVKAGQGQFILWSVQDPVLKVLNRARFDRMFKIDRATIAARQPAQRPNVAPRVLPQSRWRRAVDIMAAVVGLGGTTALLLPIAIAIKLDSPGPIFTSEMRSGYMGQQFSIWKFRTTSLPTHGPENLETLFQDAQPQVTRVGQFLRYLRLDKLPLFWNVLVGDMRLLGRHAPSSYNMDLEVPETPELRFLDSKPGILGEWRWNKAAQRIVEPLAGTEPSAGMKLLDETAAMDETQEGNEAEGQSLGLPSEASPVVPSAVRPLKNPPPPAA